MRKFSNLPLVLRIIIIVTIVLAACSLIVLGTIVGIGNYITYRMEKNSYKPDIIVTSPDGQQELVIREYTTWHDAGAEIILRKPGQDKWYNSWRENEIGYTISRTLCFSQGQYYVDWTGDQVTIYYYRGFVEKGENANDRSTWRGVFSYELE